MTTAIAVRKLVKTFGRSRALDEPTAGLDPLMESTFRDCLAEVRAEGRTVLLSSHILSEVEAVCDRVTIIRGGSANPTEDATS